MTQTTHIKLSHINKVYSSGHIHVPVLHDINLDIKHNELIAIMGPSGSGKSTLMNIIGLLDRPTSGSFIINDDELKLTMPDAGLARMRAEKIGFVFQSFNLLPKLTALQNILVPAAYAPRSKAASTKRALDLLKQLGLEKRASHKPTELSGGEKQRVAIARALINDPSIILADEPTGNLDSKSGKEVLAILQDLRKQNKTVVIITHDPSIAEKCDRTVHILDGHLTEGK